MWQHQWTEMSRTKLAETRKKYKRLCIEIQQMWNMKCNDYTDNKWSHWNGNKSFKEKFRNIQ